MGENLEEVLVPHQLIECQINIQVFFQVLQTETDDILRVFKMGGISHQIHDIAQVDVEGLLGLVDPVIITGEFRLIQSVTDQVSQGDVLESCRNDLFLGIEPVKVNILEDSSQCPSAGMVFRVGVQVEIDLSHDVVCEGLCQEIIQVSEFMPQNIVNVFTTVKMDLRIQVQDILI